MTDHRLHAIFFLQPVSANIYRTDVAIFWYTSYLLGFLLENVLSFMAYRQLFQSIKQQDQHSFVSLYFFAGRISFC